MGCTIKGYNYPMPSADRNTANSKRTGLPGESPAVQGWKFCRVHDAKGAQIRHCYLEYQHGGRNNDVVATSKIITALVREAHVHLRDMDC